jgi:hypothetical protein
MDEAERVARSSGSRSCGAPVIARRNFVWRQRDSFKDAFIILKKRKGRKHVRGLCEIEGDKAVQRREAEVYCNR